MVPVASGLGVAPSISHAVSMLVWPCCRTNPFSLLYNLPILGCDNWGAFCHSWQFFILWTHYTSNRLPLWYSKQIFSLSLATKMNTNIVILILVVPIYKIFKWQCEETLRNVPMNISLTNEIYRCFLFFPLLDFIFSTKKYLQVYRIYEAERTLRAVLSKLSILREGCFTLDRMTTANLRQRQL